MSKFFSFYILQCKFIFWSDT